MKVDTNNSQRIAANQKPPMNAPQELQKEVLRETTVGNQAPQKQMLALMATAQPQQNVNKTAQTQIQKGFLDIKI